MSATYPLVLIGGLAMTAVHQAPCLLPCNILSCLAAYVAGGKHAYASDTHFVALGATLWRQSLVHCGIHTLEATSKTRSSARYEVWGPGTCATMGHVPFMVQILAHPRPLVVLLPSQYHIPWVGMLPRIRMSYAGTRIGRKSEGSAFV